MRLVGEIVVVLALVVTVVSALLNGALVNKMLESPNQNPVDLANAMLMPSRTAYVAIVLGLVGVVLIFLGLKKKAVEP